MNFFLKNELNLKREERLVGVNSFRIFGRKFLNIGFI